MENKEPKYFWWTVEIYSAGNIIMSKEVYAETAKEAEEQVVKEVGNVLKFKAKKSYAKH